MVNERKALRFTDRTILAIIAISTIVDLVATVYYLSQGTTIVFQNIYYFTIVLAAYWYKWRGVLFCSALSGSYLCLSAYYDPQINPLIQALIRALIFVLIAVVLAYLSSRLENEKWRYHTIFSKAESGMVAILTDDYRIKEANRRFQEITGDNGVEGKCLASFLKEEDVRKLAEYQGRGEDFANIEMKLTSLTKGERTCLVSGSHLGPNETVIALLDVTERKQAEEALKDSEQRFREIFNSVNDAIYLNEMGPDFKPGAFIDINEAACRMLGYSREEFRRMTPENFAANVQQSGTDCPERQMSKSGNVKFEEMHKCRDGGLIPVENSVHLVNINGHRMALAVVRDITDRKRAEEEHRLNEETMRLVVTSAPFPLMITNWDGTHILDANSQAISAFDLEPGQGQQLADIFIEETELRSVLSTLDDRGAVDGMEVSLRSKSGGCQWHLISARTISYPGEDRLLLATYNITERRRMEEALYVANLKLGILNSITRHDILNQITVLKGFIQLGKLKEKDPILVSYLDKMSRAASNIQGQIAFTKDYQDMGVKDPIWVSVGCQTADAFDILHPAGVTLEEATEGVEVLADQLAEKVPYNLIDNSMRHGGHVTHIKMSAEQRGENMFIVYQDDGEGIDDKDRERLFEKGFGKNTGLGLFLAREILSITGISIEEKGQAGHGVRFEMEVPTGAWRRPST